MIDIYKEKKIPILNKISINGLKINIRHWQNNNNPKLLLLHGWMDCSASFQFLVDEIKELEYDIYAPDWRGMGLSEKQEFGYYDRFLMLDDLNKIIDILSPKDPINIVGHSLGGILATLYASAMLNRIKSLILVEGFGVKNYDITKSNIKLEKFLTDSKNYPKFSDLNSEDNFVKKIMERNHYLTIDKAKYLSKQLLTYDLDGKLIYNSDVKHKIEQPYPYNFDWHKFFWNQVSCKVLWIEGDLQYYNKYLSSIGKNDLDLRSKEFKRICMKKINNTGHMIHWEQPKILAQVITEFLNEKK